MSLHRLDEEATVECPDCEATGCDVDPAAGIVYQKGCVCCSGTGRVSGALDVEVGSPDGRGFRHRRPGGAVGSGIGGWSHDTYPTQAAALQSAREAAKHGA